MRSEFKFAFFLAVILLIGFVVYIILNSGSEDKEFEISTLFLKFSLIKESSVSRNIDITNTAGQNKDFFISVNNLNDMISLNKNSFSLVNLQKETLELSLSTKNYSPGIYLGQLIISTNSYNVKIPIVIEIQSDEVYFDSNIELFTRGDRIYQGGEISSEIRIFDLSNIGRKNVEMNYFIKNFDGDDIVHESEMLVVDRNLDISKSFDVPLDITKGDYVLGVILKHGDSISASSLFFKVSEKGGIKNFLGYNFYFLVILIILFFILLFFIVYWLFYREGVIAELRIMHKNELKREREIMELKRNNAFRKLKSKLERKAYNNKLKIIRKNRDKYLNKVYRNRISVVKKLKNKKNRNYLKKQMKSWRKKGYDTSVLENNINSISVNNIKKKMKNWEKKGYDTEVLR
ncbi:MAG: hypothetical protein AABW83_02300 [Nanoarchaeota archaeon]